MEEVLTLKRKEEQRRHWLVELDRQREETTERMKREKLLQSRVQWRQQKPHKQVSGHVVFNLFAWLVVSADRGARSQGQTL